MYIHLCILQRVSHTYVNTFVPTYSTCTQKSTHKDTTFNHSVCEHTSCKQTKYEHAACKYTHIIYYTYSC